MIGLGLGRIVHYVSDMEAGTQAGEIIPAIVVGVPLPGAVGQEDGMCNLTIFPDCFSGNPVCLRIAGCRFSEDKLPGTWHWPPRS